MDTSERPIIIGTAGHIDHGKSSLIKAITGTDPDRLPEEIARGMTIDLGFAFWKENIAFVDVPGHEKFIKNMVAGAYGIDAVLFVIAADDGVMPQTKEHYDIINLLNIQNGIVAITKCDLVDQDWLKLICDDVREFLNRGLLKEAEMFQVDSISGKGIDQVKQALTKLSSCRIETKNHLPVCIPIDRIFVKQGFGVVVTGTVKSGKVKVGDILEVLPTKKRVRIRGIQTQQKDVNQVQSRMRAALNLTSIMYDEIERGYRLCEVGVWQSTKTFSAFLKFTSGRKLKNRSRVRIHIGTAEVIGRVLFLTQLFDENSVFALFQLETETVVTYKEKFIIRQYSPMETIGGGTVLIPVNDIMVNKNLNLLCKLNDCSESEEILIILDSFFHNIVSKQRLQSLLSISSEILDERVLSIQNKIIQAENFLLLNSSKSHWQQVIIEKIQLFHNQHPERFGIPIHQLEITELIGKTFLNQLIDELIRENKIEARNNLLKLTEHKITLNSQLKKQFEQLKDYLIKSALSSPTVSTISNELKMDEKSVFYLIELLKEQDVIVILDGKYLLIKDHYEQSKQKILNFLNQHSEITIAQTAQLLNTTRKVVVPLLEDLDSQKVTVRMDDKRILLK